MYILFTILQLTPGTDGADKINAMQCTVFCCCTMDTGSITREARVRVHIIRLGWWTEGHIDP